MDSVDASKFRVLNMLNTKYFILPSGQQGQTVPVLNLMPTATPGL